ncbi:hypothetical protein M2323_002158 [Rhodoblastus acidophilus]|uniref:hypothetical protein n=1 Tax=Rhodoblastus acidophilus TaxID=1074 RepID=UPI002224884D|nr:hypothetical protein [Rhodoblastus acidophilus]MCW2284293.1 hypothetical protein [Rhodoblastus acidophilus]MCW2333229.1 hypothetical protein [Rhodoblastus acidophilus]
MDMQGRYSKGVVYLAWGEKFISEARNSVSSVKRHNQIPCTLITNHEIEPGQFDSVVNLQLQNSYKDKVLINQSPYSKTVFLDTDTTILGSLDQIFDLLDVFDIAFCPASGGLHYTLPGVPMEAFPEPSAGIIAWRKNERTDRLFELWAHHYDLIQSAEGEGAWDQRSLRAALYYSNVRLTMLPDIWQAYTFDSARLLGAVKMVHGRGKRLAWSIKHLQSREDYRIWLPPVGSLGMYKTSPDDYVRISISSLFFAMKRSLRLLLHASVIWRLPENKRPM